MHWTGLPRVVAIRVVLPIDWLHNQFIGSSCGAQRSHSKVCSRKNSAQTGSCTIPSIDRTRYGVVCIPNDALCCCRQVTRQ